MTSGSRRLSRYVTAVALAGAFLISAGIVAADAADFYQGKQLTIIVGSSSGGGYDTYARAISRHISRFLPGKPTVVVQNMPGAGSVKASNYLYNVAPKDGTAIAAVFSGIPAQPLIDPSGVKFDVRKFTWLGSAAQSTFVGYVWHTAPVQSLEQLKTQEMIVGSSGGATREFPMISDAVLGLKFKIVEGYKGTNETGLAVERGEVQGDAGITWDSLEAQHYQWLKDKKIRVFVQYGSEPNPELKDVPLMMSLAKTKADRQALNLEFSRGDFARPYIAPPGLPTDRVKMLRTAFMDTMKDKAYVADAKKLHLDVNAIPGEKVDALIAELYETPQSAVERVRKVIGAPAAKK
jgi:tripartite-type tricarboxylate transporter receptor subunit TctC